MKKLKIKDYKANKLLYYIQPWLTFTSYLMLTAIIGSVIYFYGSDIFLTLAKVKWWIIGILIFLHIPMIASGGLAFQILCSRFDIHLRFQDWFGLSFIANLLNQILPYRPGMGFRYLYLHQRYHIGATQFIYIMLVYFLLTLAVSSIFTLVGWQISNLSKSFTHITLMALLLILLISGLILWLKGKNIQNIDEPSKIFPHHFIQKSLHGMKILINSPAILLSVTGAIILSNLLTALIFYIIFIGIGVNIPFSDCIFLVGIIALAMIFPITPGNIGVLETLIGTITQMMYNDFSLGFSATALYRASQWITSIVLGTTFSFILAGSIIPSFKNIKIDAARIKGER